jgi:hypothetical protein
LVLGILLVVVGVPAVLAGVASVVALHHRDSTGAFSAELSTVHSDGYAVVVPDLATVVSRDGIGALLGSGTLRITLHSSAAPVVMLLAPSDQVRTYLAGVAHSEVVSVGYATGPLPVSLVALGGTRPPAPSWEQTFWQQASTGELDWPGTASESTALVLVRADGRPGIDANMSVGRTVPWLPRASWSLLIGGVTGLIGGIALLIVMAEPARSIFDAAGGLGESAYRGPGYEDAVAGHASHESGGGYRNVRHQPGGQEEFYDEYASDEYALDEPGHDGYGPHGYDPAGYGSPGYATAGYGSHGYGSGAYGSDGYGHVGVDDDGYDPDGVDYDGYELDPAERPVPPWNSGTAPAPYVDTAT